MEFPVIVHIIGVTVFWLAMAAAVATDLTRFRIPNAIPLVVLLAFPPTVLSLGWSVEQTLPHLAAGAGL